MTTLYRCPTPTNYLCNCGKVARRLMLDVQTGAVDVKTLGGG